MIVLEREKCDQERERVGGGPVGNKDGCWLAVMLQKFYVVSLSSSSLLCYFLFLQYHLRLCSCCLHFDGMCSGKKHLKDVFHKLRFNCSFQQDH